MAENTGVNDPITAAASVPETRAASMSKHATGAVFKSWFERANAWLDIRMEWLIGIVALIGLGLRIRLARASYFNGDETQIISPPLQHGILRVYEAALHLPYGPLMNFGLHFMTFFGSSELYFRMPSVIAGTLLIFVGYQWVAESFGKSAGFVTGLLLAFSPPLIILSAQVRYYMVHA